MTAALHIAQKLARVFDALHNTWESLRAYRWISSIVLLTMLAGIGIVLLQNWHWISFHEATTYFGIELAFNLLLIFELIGLLFVFSQSVADSVGRQFEIISLMLLRDAFKEFGKINYHIDWTADAVYTFLPVLTDAFGAVVLFFITGLYYKAQKHHKITSTKEEQENFLLVKKILALVLFILFVLLGVKDLVSSFLQLTYISSFHTFFTILIYTDMFILLFSLRYNTRYYNLFRYSGFAFATVLLRLSLSAHHYLNVAFSLIAGLFILSITSIYNYLTITEKTT